MRDSVDLTSVSKITVIISTIIAILSVYVSFSSSATMIAVGGLVIAAIAWLISGGVMSFNLSKQIESRQTQLEAGEMDVGTVRRKELEDGTQIIYILTESKEGEPIWNFKVIDESGSEIERFVLTQDEPNRDSNTESEEEVDDE